MANYGMMIALYLLYFVCLSNNQQPAHDTIFDDEQKVQNIDKRSDIKTDEHGAEYLNNLIISGNIKLPPHIYTWPAILAHLNSLHSLRGINYTTVSLPFRAQNSRKHSNNHNSLLFSQKQFKQPFTYLLHRKRSTAMEMTKDHRAYIINHLQHFNQYRHVEETKRWSNLCGVSVKQIEKISKVQSVYYDSICDRLVKFMLKANDINRDYKEIRFFYVWKSDEKTFVNVSLWVQLYSNNRIVKKSKKDMRNLSITNAIYRKNYSSLIINPLIELMNTVFKYITVSPKKSDLIKMAQVRNLINRLKVLPIKEDHIIHQQHSIQHKRIRRSANMCCNVESENSTGIINSDEITESLSPGHQAVLVATITGVLVISLGIILLMLFLWRKQGVPFQTEEYALPNINRCV